MGQPLANDQTDQEFQDNRDSVRYKERQCGCFWVFYLIGGIIGIVTFISSMASGHYLVTNDIVGAVIILIWAAASAWTQVEDMDHYLLVTYGPVRWLLCGMGKEKVLYSRITDFSLTQTCTYGVGCNCAYPTIKLFNTCSCCCGGASLCGQKTVQIGIRERPHGGGAGDDGDCCLEACCLANCYGENGKYIGKGCCCQPICNPCNANCCMVNTLFVSTNDPEGLLRLLEEKTRLHEAQEAVI